MSALWKLAIATPKIINEVYNGGFVAKFSVSILKETSSLVRTYEYEITNEKQI